MKVLYGVSSVGLGHARRSIEIASRLRKLGDYEIEWVSSEPSTTFIQSKGEKLLPICSELKTLSEAMERRVKDGRLNDISSVATASSDIGRENYGKLMPFLVNYNALIQDELAETMFSFMWEKKPSLPKKRVIVTDYFRFETMSRNPLNRIIVWYANRMLAKAYGNSELRIFVDEPDSVPNRLPKFEIVGPILAQVPRETREELREKFSPLSGNVIVVVAVGGTSIGKRLLDFMVENEKRIQDSLGNVGLIFLLGPRIERKAYPKDNERVQFVPFTTESISYYKLADCVVTQAGASTLNEVSSVGTPCVAIPIKNHWEQQASAKRFSKKYGFRIVQYDELDKELIVDAIKRAMNSRYEPQQSDGAERAAELIHNYLKNN